MKPTDSQLLRKFSVFYGKRRFSMPFPQHPATFPYPEPDGIHFTPRRPILDGPLPYQTAIMPEFYSFPRLSPKHYMYFLSHLPAPHVSPHQDNYFVLINSNN
jgi:hypothetical protein